MGSRRRVKPSIRTQTAVLCLQYVTEGDSIHRKGRDSCWQQSGTSHVLLLPLNGPTDPVLHHSSFTGSQ